MFVQLPDDLRESISTEAGILLTDFDPENPGDAEAIKANIIMATSGGVSASCVATLKDFGSDIDNCPKNTMELAEIEGYECTIAGTGVTVNVASAKSMMGAADSQTSESGVTEIAPTMTLKTEHFKTLWYVCKYGTAGGFVAVKLENALSTGGFSMQSTDREKGKYAFSYKGYSSIENPTEVPFKYYIKPSAGAEAAQVNMG
jgi:hypothetical protein